MDSSFALLRSRLGHSFYMSKCCVRQSQGRTGSRYRVSGLSDELMSRGSIVYSLCIVLNKYCNS